MNGPNVKFTAEYSPFILMLWEAGDLKNTDNKQAIQKQCS
jgi:hypothetical protein